MQDSLFTLADPAQPGAPLAARMRPCSLDEFVGQTDLVGPGRALRRAIESGRLGSIVLWGPPGSGKTTLAGILVGLHGGRADYLSAVTAGVAELRKVIAAARSDRGRGRRTVLVVDEIHRWSKAQQDALLPSVEDGTILLIGLTSENPYFDIIAPLRSRLRIYRLEPLTAGDLHAILMRALTDPDRGLGRPEAELDPAAAEALVATSGGDARMMLNGLEAAAVLAPDRIIDEATVREALQRRSVRYDRAGDDHYQTASAFIKSLRGCDPDAAIFYLAKMIDAGEEPRFIARRLVILASEDIGNADPPALVLAEAAARAVEHVGMPESGLILAQATTYLACAPKSNASARALWAAQAAIEAGANLEVPLHLRNASFGGAKGLGYGRGYEYIHDFPPDDPRRYQQRFLPDGVDGPFYDPPP
ncbi:MAG TPA: replication-associated recombination protein A, partial [Dehalococcoidia bacterium]|nr:replication-associated recombination protein A [Dehalococcoidia bacterium]